MRAVFSQEIQVHQVAAPDRRVYRFAALFLCRVSWICHGFSFIIISILLNWNDCYARIVHRFVGTGIP